MMRRPSTSACHSKRHFGLRVGSRRGVVLVVVLVLVVMVALAGFAFLSEMTTEYEATRINGSLLQAQQAMSSAESLLLVVAEDPSSVMAGTEERKIDPLHNNPQLFQSRTVRSVKMTQEQSADGTSSVGSADSWRFAVVNHLPTIAHDFTDLTGTNPLDEASTDFLPEPFRFGLQNESAKLHLSLIRELEVLEPGAGQRILMLVPGMSPEAADAILDWMDTDNVPREFGAESSYYQALDTPYHPRNDLPESLSELLYVKRVPRAAFYGAAATTESSTGIPPMPWADFLTVHSAERNADRSGQPRLNLNGVTAEQLSELESHLSTFLPPEMARYIRLARTYGVTAGVKEGIAPLAVPDAAVNSLSSDTSLFELDSLTDLMDSGVHLPSSVGGQIVSSPLLSADSAALEMFAILEDRTTTSFEEVLPGRININLASEYVLQAILRDPAVSAQIVQQRAILETEQQLSTLWLFTQQIVDLETYKLIYPYITTGGHVYSAEIVVYRKFGGPFLRRKITIDAANRPARRVSWIDLSEQGLPVSLNDLEQRTDAR